MHEKIARNQKQILPEVITKVFDRFQSDFIKIKKPKSIFDHSKNALQPKLHLPKKIAEKYDIPFYNVMHNSLEAQRLIQEFEINFGIISGSRILKKEIISLVKYGILNFHPGKSNLRSLKL